MIPIFQDMKVRLREAGTGTRPHSQEAGELCLNPDFGACALKCHALVGVSIQGTPAPPLLCPVVSVPSPRPTPAASGFPQLANLPSWPPAQPWSSPLALCPAWDVQLEPCHPSAVFQQRTGGGPRAWRPQGEAWERGLGPGAPPPTKRGRRAT